MSKSDRWGELASELGVDQVKPASPPPAVEPPKAVAPPVPAARPSAPRPQKPSTDWSRLAGDLGLDASIVPPPPPKRAPSPPSPPPVSPPPVRSESSERPPRAERSEPRSEERSERSRPRRDRSERSAEPRQSTRRPEPPSAAFEAPRSEDIELEPLDSDLAASDPPREEGGEGEDRPRRRRRRRGGRGRSRRGDERGSVRPTGRSGDRSNVDVPPDSPDLSDAPWSVEPAFRDVDDFGPAGFEDAADFHEVLDEAHDAAIEGTVEPGESAEGDALRPRRRRRRRGRGGRDRAERGTRSDAPVGRSESRTPESRTPDSAELPFDDDHHDDDLDLHDAEPHDEHFDGDDGHDLDKSHRSVPSWEEAIGMLVAVNMEARTNSPNSRPAHRGRGRGRGGNGGGRGRRDGGR